MKLIEEAKHWWKMFSVQAMALAGALQMAWVAIPDDLKASIDHRIVTVLTLILLMAGIFGRLVKQDSVSGQ